MKSIKYNKRASCFVLWLIISFSYLPLVYPQEKPDCLRVPIGLKRPRVTKTAKSISPTSRQLFRYLRRDTKLEGAVEGGP